MKKKFYCLCMGMLLGISSVEAKVTLPSIISDNMVLQAQTKVCIWGKAAPGENISVAPSWNEKSIRHYGWKRRTLEGIYIYTQSVRQSLPDS